MKFGISIKESILLQLLTSNEVFTRVNGLAKNRNIHPLMKD